MSGSPEGRIRSALSSRAARWIVAGLALLALALGGRALVGGKAAGKDAEPVRVRREDLVMTVDVTGELAAVRGTDIGAPPVRDLWDFKISFLVPESSAVKKGQPVIGFDTQPLEKALEGEAGRVRRGLQADRAQGDRPRPADQGSGALPGRGRGAAGEGAVEDRGPAGAEGPHRGAAGPPRAGGRREGGREPAREDRLPSGRREIST